VKHSADVALKYEARSQIYVAQPRPAESPPCGWSTGANGVTHQLRSLEPGTIFWPPFDKALKASIGGVLCRRRYKRATKKLACP
jgi:hypothetical protein